jgi:hypothetical protein
MAESTFNPQAISEQGKVGLLQINPAEGEAMAKEAGAAWEGAEGLKDSAYNLQLGLSRLKTLVGSSGKKGLKQGLLTYNLGEEQAAAILGGQEKMPLLAERYLDNVQSYYKQWQGEIAKPAALKRAKQPPAL